MDLYNTLSIQTSNVLEKSLVIWDHTVLPANWQRCRGALPDFTLVFISTHYHAMDGVRLSRSRHSSKGVQPVPNGCCDKRKATVGFDPGTSHTTRPYSLICKFYMHCLVTTSEFC